MSEPKDLEPDTFTFVEARGENVLMRCRHGWMVLMTKKSLAQRKSEWNEWKQRQGDKYD